MRASRPVYAIICEYEGSGGIGKPIVMESPVSASKEDLEMRVAGFSGRYGQCFIVELPIQVTTSITRIAGSTDKVTNPSIN